MSPREDSRKSERIAEVAALARRRLAADQRDVAEAFLHRFYANVAAEDLLERRVEDLYGAGVALWQFGRTRSAGQAKIRVYTPRLAEHGWASLHSVIEIVNDDMPFLVDSVTTELNRRDLAVHLVIHPVVKIARDRAGTATGLAPDGQPESFMHIEIDAQSDAETLAGIQSGIAAVLADVRAAVSDWRAMVGRLQAVIAALDQQPPPVPAAEVATARNFLKWIAANNFSFLGFREYAFAGEGGEARANVVPGQGLGLARDDGFVIFDGLRNLAALPPDVQVFVREPRLLKIAKANRRSTVHRPALLDTIGIKKFGAKGEVVGERIFVGLFTSAAYSQRPRDIPMLSDMIGRIVERAGLPPSGHDAKALLHILETFPRDELFQASEDDLLDISLGILQLQERQRIALFVRRDPFERFVSCLVYVPRDRYTTELRLKFQKILETAFAGTITTFASQFADEAPLVRVHFIVKTAPGKIPAYRADEITAQLIEAGRSFADRLRDKLIETHGEERGLTVFRRYADAFSTAYRERFAPEAAVADIAKVESVLAGDEAMALNLYRNVEASENELGLRLFHKGRSVPLSDILPMLENMGIRVLTEVPYQITPAKAAEPVWMHDLALVARDAREVDLAAVKPAFEEAFAAVSTGAAESDGFNRLVIGAGLSAREVVVLRAYAKYLRQIGIPFSQAYMEDTLARYPLIARRLTDLFRCLHDPAAAARAKAKGGEIQGEINHLLDGVANLDDDRILRRFLNLVQATQRTNFFQKTANGAAKPYLSLKLDSQTIEELPLPRPLVEIFVYSPRVEAIHMRGGRVARGGIRWSDRREDFRTEVLGLMKAQMVKNVVIVPVGSKGGFFVKRPPPPDAGREAAQAEGIECYKLMMRGLLDVTDNISPTGIVPPSDVVRRDRDDPYLVVAADKGTATFSDIANGVSREYKFWLDDAFASGGSAGYDHKGMAITARGAWEAVKRHFRELGHDTQSADFTVIGVGDMSGDVFGNGMLRSRHTKLLGAFDHRHIFFDPAPDAEAAFAERERMFKLPRSSWADYNAKLISAGGGVFERKAKAIKPSPQVKALLGLAADQATPAEVIKAMLRARVDLLWLGGIGTYVKAATESSADVGDRANDALRIDGRDIRARVAGEGANLGMTQRGRVEYAQFGGEGKGGRINTDAIDNSAGVDTSDHEVNIKILLGDIVARGDMTMKQRDQLMAQMTDEVAELVLRDNYLQTQALTLAEAEGVGALDRQVRFIRGLEKSGRLNRAIEFLPDEEEIAQRLAGGRGLTRPELAVLLAYAKLTLYDDLLASDLPDDSHFAEDLLRYFPEPLRKGHEAAIGRHRLRREIIATVATNSLVNRVGPCFVNDMAERTGESASQIARAYVVSRQVFGLRRLWAAIEALDNKVPAAAQTRMLLAIGAPLERVCVWLLRHAPGPIDIAQTIARYEPGVAAFRAALATSLDPSRAASLADRTGALTGLGAPAELAGEVAGLDDLVAAPELVRIAERHRVAIGDVAALYFAVGARFGCDWLRDVAARVKAETSWQKRAVAAIVEDLLAQQADLAAHALGAADGTKGATAIVEAWTHKRGSALGRFEGLLTELRATPAPDLAALTLASRELRALAQD